MMKSNLETTKEQIEKEIETMSLIYKDLHNKWNETRILLEEAQKKDNILFLKSSIGRCFRMVRERNQEEQQGYIFNIFKYRMITGFNDDNDTVKGVTLLKEQRNGSREIISYNNDSYEHFLDLKDCYEEVSKKEYDKIYNEFLSILNDNVNSSRNVIFEKNNA